MFKQILISFLFLAFIGATVYYGCKGDAKVIESKANSEVAAKARGDHYEGCYRMVVYKDTAEMNIQKNGQGYAGKLTYTKWFKEKRQITTGTVVLWPKGDYLQGYHLLFTSGVNYREIYLKPDGEDLVEGYGDAELSHDTLAYKFPANLEYDLSNPFKKIACAQ